jgi:hypothetical protein
MPSPYYYGAFVLLGDTSPVTFGNRTVVGTGNDV